MDLPSEFFDDYEHLDKDLEYVLENVLSENVKNNINKCAESKQLHESFNTLLLNKCDCNNVYQNQCLKCYHGGNYTFDEETQELVLNDCGVMPELIYECSNLCTCNSKKCLNRLVQYGPRKFLKIVHSPQYCSKGLITTRDIPRGAFICEYAGELITTREAKNILRKNEIYRKMNYILFLKESCMSSNATPNDDTETCVTIVNPSKKGNIGRYLNHSCEPNSKVISVRIDCPIPKVCFFSKRFIKAGEEICFNYNEGQKCNITENKSSGIPCLCGSTNCMKSLPNSE